MTYNKYYKCEKCPTTFTARHTFADAKIIHPICYECWKELTDEEQDYYDQSKDINNGK